MGTLNLSKTMILLSSAVVISGISMSLLRTQGSDKSDTVEHGIQYYEKARVYEDPTNTTTVADIPGILPKMQEADIFNLYRYSNSTFWLAFDVVSKNSIRNDILVGLQNKGLYDVQLYPLQNGKLANTTINRLNSPIPRYEISNILPGQNLTILAKMRFADLLATKIIVMSESPLDKQNDSWLHLFNGIFLGVFAALFTYNLFLYFTLADKNFIFYSLYTLSAGLAAAGLHGIPRMMGMGDGYAYLTPLSAGTALICSLVFTRTYLDTRKFAGVIDKVLLMIILLAFVCVACLASGRLNEMEYGLDVLISVAILLCVFVGIKGYFLGIQLARYYLASWLAVIITSVVWSLTIYQILPFNEFSERCWDLGIATQLMLLSFGLTDQVKKARDRYEANLHAANDLLESKVKARTAMIESQQITLIESAKLASLGKMAGGIAHEINTPLMVISGYAETLKTLLDQDPRQREMAQKIFGKILHAIERISKIIHGLKTIARDSQQDPFKLEKLADIFEDTMELSHKRFDNSSITLTLQNKPPPDVLVECRIVQISQVLINLLNNAFDELEAKKDAWVKLDYAMSEEWLEISVTDSGTGIPPATLEKIFDPFYTTKAVGKGTGLGLSMSQGIAKTHQGDLYYDTSSSNTKFVLKLPLRQSITQQKAA